MELTKTGKVNFDGEVLDESLVCCYCYRIFLWANTRVKHEQLHADVKKHKQIMKNLYLKELIVKIYPIKSVILDNGEEPIAEISVNNEMNKSVEIAAISVNEASVPICSVKNEQTKIEDKNSRFFFNCSKCPEKFFSSIILRNHNCNTTQLLNPSDSKKEMVIEDIVTIEKSSSFQTGIPPQENISEQNIEKNKCIKQRTKDNKDEMKPFNYAINYSENKDNKLACTVCCFTCRDIETIFLQILF